MPRLLWAAAQHHCDLRREVSWALEDGRRERGIETRAPGGESVTAEARGSGLVRWVHGPKERIWE